jgi:glycosyltransferase involved in cell wall biosynthesis
MKKKSLLTFSPGIERKHDKYPRVSILIPCYNHAHYLGDAIRSVLSQTYSDFEVIVIDDGSSDNTRQVAESFGDRIRYIYQENAGLSAARNTGIQVAQGDLIALLDADDMYESEFLKTITSYFDNNEDIDAIYCGFQFVDGINKPLPQPGDTVYPSDKLYQVLLKGNFFVPASMVAHKYCYETEGLFDKSLSGVADWEMWLRITKKYKVLGIRERLVRYRIVIQSMSSNPDLMLSDRLSVIRKHIGKDLSTFMTWDKDEREAYARVYLAGTVEYLQVHNFEKAYECFKQMILIMPDLVQAEDVWGELSWGDQPRGIRGDYATLNIKRSEGYLLSLLDRLWRDADVGSSMAIRKNSTYASAYYSLGLRCYFGGELQKARRYFIRVVQVDFNWLFRKELNLIFLKSLLGLRLVNWLRPLSGTLV